jgi:hypothetical protein
MILQCVVSGLAECVSVISRCDPNTVATHSSCNKLIVINYMFRLFYTRDAIRR